MTNSWYGAAMSKSTDSIVEVMPSATPTEEEIRAWQALPRDEQLHRLRAALTHPDCGIPTTDTMRDVLVQARARAESRRG
jgi:hypothetical protein